MKKQASIEQDASFGLPERRALSTRVHRLGVLADEISGQIVALFGKNVLPPSALPPALRVVRPPAGSARPAPAKPAPTRAAQPAKKKRFGLFG